MGREDVLNDTGGGMATETLIHPDYLNIKSTEQPYSPIEALMQAIPNHDAEESQLETLERRERDGALLDGALAQLDPIEREILDACIIERLPLRKLAERFEGRHSYGKTWLAHLRDRALDKMRVYLEEQHQCD